MLLNSVLELLKYFSHTLFTMVPGFRYRFSTENDFSLLKGTTSFFVFDTFRFDAENKNFLKRQYLNYYIFKSRRYLWFLNLYFSLQTVGSVIYLWSSVYQSFWASQSVLHHLIVCCLLVSLISCWGQSYNQCQ